MKPSFNDRRRCQRSRIRVPCMLELFSGLMIRGYTQNLSIDGVFMDSQSLNLEGRNPPATGDVGVFSLFYQRGNIQDKLIVDAMEEEAKAALEKADTKKE